MSAWRREGMAARWLRGGVGRPASLMYVFPPFFEFYLKKNSFYPNFLNYGCKNFFLQFFSKTFPFKFFSLIFFHFSHFLIFFVLDARMFSLIFFIKTFPFNFFPFISIFS